MTKPKFGRNVPYKIALPSLFPEQRAIMEHKARFKVVGCGRRFGKTTLSTYALSRAASSTSYPYAYMVPTYKMLTEVWRELRHTLDPLIAHKSETERRLDLVTGSTIEMWSLDSPNIVRGRFYAGIVIDEAALVPNGFVVYNKIIRPTLTDLKGWVMFLSSPFGRNWFFQLYQRGIDPLFPEWASWRYPTLANPYIDPREIEDLRHETPPLIFAQEYEAEFVSDQEAVFRNIDAVCVGKPQKPDPHAKYIYGIDWGRSIDFTVVVIMDVDTRQMVYLERLPRLSWIQQRRHIIELCQRYHPLRVVAESNAAGMPNIENLRDAGIPIEGYNTNQESKRNLIEYLIIAFEEGSITLLDDPLLRGEFETFEMLFDGSKIRYGAPSGGHDDIVMATALAYTGLLSTVYRHRLSIA